jgi:glycosyltransferase involved in cell wall biosynthesis
MISRVPVGSYTSKLLKGFSISSPDHRIVVYAPRGESRTENYIRLVEVWTPGRYPFQIFRELCRDKPDIVHLQHEFGVFGDPLALSLAPVLYIFLKLLRVKVVTTLHSMVFPDSLSRDSIGDLLPAFSRIPKILVELGLRMTYSCACGFSNLVIVHQQSHKRKLEKYYQIGGSKISFVPHGVGPTEYASSQESFSTWRTKFGHARVMLYLGYISPRKGIEYLIDAFEAFTRRRPEWTLVLAGGLSKRYYEPYRKRIVDAITGKGLNDKVVMTGFVPESDADALYRLCDIVVLPYTQVVGNASACNLAMAYGKPIIATNLSPFPEEIENFQQGLLCPPRDSAELLAAMEKLCSDERLYTYMSNNLARLGKMRDWAVVASETQRLYALTLQGGNYRAGPSHS